MNRANFILFIFIVNTVLLLTGCSKKTTIPILINNSIEEAMEDRDLQSHINLNFKIDKDSLNKSFNSILDSLFINDMNMSAMGFEVEILNLKNASLEIQGKQVLTNLPLQINLKKETFLSDINIDGNLMVTFITELEVDSIWRVDSKTTLEDYNWLKRPELSVGGLNISVKSLANIIIAQSKLKLENQIDSIMTDQFKLKDQVERMMYFLKDPILLDSTLSKWLSFTPDSIMLSEVNNAQSFYGGNVAIYGEPNILNTKPQKKNSENSLPEFKWIMPEKKSSQLKLAFDISIEKLTKYVNLNFANKPLSNDGKEIILSDIKISISNQLLVCTAKSNGDFTGSILISGIPKFDYSTQSLITDDVEIDFQTDNVLHKAGLWLMRGKIKNKLSSMLNFSLTDKIKDIQSVINAQTKSLSKDYDMDLKCDINQISFEQFILSKEDLKVFLFIDFYLESIINSLLKLQSLPD